MREKIFPNQNDIKLICRFFNIGNILHIEKEKDLSPPHTHLFVLVTTNQGQYALKFYPANCTQAIATEYTINHLLVKDRFPTPMMFKGQDDQPFFTGNDELVCCYSYINGTPAWQLIQKRKTFHQINTALFSLKNILSASMGRLSFHRQKSLVTTINHLTKISRDIAPSGAQKIIEASLLDACRTYQQHLPLFTIQWTHNNATLTNFLIYKDTAYTLDLEHVWQDFSLNDLACLIVSCLLINRPPQTIAPIIKDYFTRHKIPVENYFPLNALVKIRLIRRYLNNIRYERSIPALLKRMNENPRLIV